MKARVLRALPVLVGLAVFVAALEVLRAELHATSWQEITRDVFATPPAALAAALGLSALNYLALTGYDLLAFAYIGKAMPRARIAVASFLAYAISNSVGFGMLSGASVRYRFYSRWGVTAGELSRIVFSYSVTFWLGLVALGGLSLAVGPLPGAEGVPGHLLLRVVGWLLMATVAAYLVAAAVRTTPVRLFRLSVRLPTARIAIAQLLVSMVEWALAGAVLYVLLPPTSGLPFLTFLGSFLVAILVGMVSHVPGGLGVFEGLLVLLLKPWVASGDLLPALVVFRVVYYLLPLSVALAGIVADEAHRRRAQAARVGAWLGQLTELLTPRLLAAFTFLAGLVLLFSGATPAAPGRLDLLDRFLPLGVIEVSHFLGSVAGAGLLVLSQGLARRLDGAYFFSSMLITIGMTASLLKGFDYEEATLLLLILLVLRRARPAFDRRAAFFDTRFSPAWMAALVGAIGASIWLGFFAFKHVDYANELWWQFELHGQASRFLRASVGAAVVVLLVGVARLLRHAPHEATAPTAADLDDAARIIGAQTATSPNLVYLLDKALIFNQDRSGFVMYAVKGRTWVALGDPVGPDDRISDLIRLFLERCDDFGGVPVFYEIGMTHLHRYTDFGLTFVKLGEEARVNLSTFTLQGGHASKRRQALRYLERDGGTFRIVSPAEVPGIIDELRTVSDDWLATKPGGEKGFSLGFFDEAYVSRFPVAVVERQGRVEAFASLWLGAGQVEMSIDLMRHRRDAPRSVMEALVVHLLQWGQQQGYQWFALGMAPLSGFEQSPVASLWTRVGAFLYAHGEAVYNFQGLRAYKEKFDPVWEPHYLAYPGGLRLARIIADISALVAGGYRRIVLK